MSSVATEKSKPLAQLASDIKQHHRAVKRSLSSMLESALAAGDALLQAKTKLKHGMFLPWLKSAGIGNRTAQQYMNIAKHRAELEAAKAQTPALFSIAKALAIIDELHQRSPNHRVKDAGKKERSSEIERTRDQRAEQQVARPKVTDEVNPNATDDETGEKDVETEDKVDHANALKSAPRSQRGRSDQPRKASLSERLATGNCNRGESDILKAFNEVMERPKSDLTEYLIKCLENIKTAMALKCRKREDQSDDFYQEVKKAAFTQLRSDLLAMAPEAVVAPLLDEQ